MNPNLFKNLNSPDLWSSITMMDDVEYTPIQIHNMTGYHTPEVEQPSCDYCEWDWSARETLKDDESVLEIIGNRLEIGHCELDNVVKYYSVFEVNFCPMCGKRLETDQ